MVAAFCGSGTSTRAPRLPTLTRTRSRPPLPRPAQIFEKAKSSSKAPVIDVTKAGFFKVLGKGNLPDVPLVVKARYFSKKAEAAIKAAGGACVLTA